MKEERKNKLAPWLVIFILISIALGGYIAYDKGYLDSLLGIEEEVQPKPVVPKDDANEISYQQVSSLLAMAGINYNSTPNYLYLTLFDKTGEISKLTDEEKILIVYEYARSQKMLKEVTSEQSEYCQYGSGTCYAMTSSVYNQIAKIYGLSETAPELLGDLEKYNNMYLYGEIAYATNMDNIEHDFEIKYNNEDIVINDSVTYEDSETKETTIKQKTYTYKLRTDGNYYLYSIS